MNRILITLLTAGLAGPVQAEIAMPDRIECWATWSRLAPTGKKTELPPGTDRPFEFILWRDGSEYDWFRREAPEDVKRHRIPVIKIATHFPEPDPGKLFVLESYKLDPYNGLMNVSTIKIYDLFGGDPTYTHSEYFDQQHDSWGGRCEAD